jgi:hypothetical protein
VKTEGFSSNRPYVGHRFILQAFISGTDGLIQAYTLQVLQFIGNLTEHGKNSDGKKTLLSETNKVFPVNKS